MGMDAEARLFWGIIEPEAGAWRRGAEDDEIARELGVELVRLGYGDGGTVYGLALIETVWKSEWSDDVRPWEPGQTRRLYSWDAYQGRETIELVAPGTIPTPEWDDRLDQAIERLKLNLAGRTDEDGYVWCKPTAPRGWILSSYYG